MMPTLVMDDRFAGLFLFSISLLSSLSTSFFHRGRPSRCHSLGPFWGGEMVKMAAAILLLRSDAEESEHLNHHHRRSVDKWTRECDARRADNNNNKIEARGKSYKEEEETLVFANRAENTQREVWALSSLSCGFFNLERLWGCLKKEKRRQDRLTLLGSFLRLNTWESALQLQQQQQQTLGRRRCTYVYIRTSHSRRYRAERDYKSNIRRVVVA